MKLFNTIYHTLSYRLSLMMVLAIAVLLIASLSVMFHYSRQTLREEVMQTANLTLESTMLHIDNILLKISQTETTVSFIVEDIGPGLPEESLDQIILPFIKIDDLSEGLGLGLPLTKRHGESLGGRLIPDTSYHHGCRFIIEMPK